MEATIEHNSDHPIYTDDKKAKEIQAAERETDVYISAYHEVGTLKQKDKKKHFWENPFMFPSKVDGISLISLALICVQETALHRFQLYFDTDLLLVSMYNTIIV